MKLRRTALLVYSFVIGLNVTAQSAVNMKFGKPTKEELQMTTYAEDSTAEAVVLCRLTDVNFSIQQNGYLVDYHEKIRIKVLKPEGTRWANMTIPYYKIDTDKNKMRASKFSLMTGDMSGNFIQGGSFIDNALGNFSDEDVEDLKVIAYNLEGNKTVKSSLNKKTVVKEQVDEQQYQLRFTVPNVKVGTVIECEYTIHSELFYMIHDWYAQCEIPVMYAKLYMDVPCYLIYNMEEQGVQRLNCQCITGSMNYKLESDPLAAPVNVRTNRYTCVGRNLKGIPRDMNVWNVNDYYAGIIMELKSFSLQNTMMMDCIKSWEQIDQILLDDEDLGKQLSHHSPLRQELENAKVTDITSQKERAEAVCKLVMDHVKWNEKYALWPRSTSETLKEGSGSNADINMLLIQSLRDAGLDASPIVLRSRDKGLLPHNFPSLRKLTTYIIAVNTDSSNVYIDASMGGKVNLLPASLIVERARMVQSGKKSHWVNLRNVQKSSR
ncbi:MAG: DUF3857 domain-containing protein [Prevotella sp.]|nr:DUF3857 domain-containing protein [Prevotella sp.]